MDARTLKYTVPEAISVADVKSAVQFMNQQKQQGKYALVHLHAEAGWSPIKKSAPIYIATKPYDKGSLVDWKSSSYGVFIILRRKGVGVDAPGKWLVEDIIQTKDVEEAIRAFYGGLRRATVLQDTGMYESNMVVMRLPEMERNADKNEVIANEIHQCSNCGHRLSETANFCSNCGKKILSQH